MQVLLGQWTRYLLQLASVIALARLLPPSQYGLVGMITAIVGVADVVRDFGLSNAAMQAKSLDDKQVSALVWINVGIGLVCTLVVVALAPAIAHFYHRPGLAILTVALAPIFVINGAATQFQASLVRGSRFGRTAVADGASMAVALAVAITLALRSPTVWALVVLQLTAAVVRLLFLALGQLGLVGRWRAAPLGSLLRFGRNVTFVQLLDYASRNVDTILVGRYWGPSQVGLYNNAYQLLLLPLQQFNGPLTRVAMPVLARIRDDKKQYEDYLASAILMLSLFATVTYALLAAMGTDVIVLLLGGHWAAAGPIFQAMCLAGLFQAINYVSYWQFMAQDRTGTHLRYSLFSKPVVLLGFVIAAPYGVTAVAWSYSITTALVVPGGFYLACRGSGVSLKRLVVAASRPLPLGVVLFGGTFFVRHLLHTSSHLLALLVCTCVGALLTLLVAAVSSSCRQDFAAVAATLGTAIPSVSRILPRRRVKAEPLAEVLLSEPVGAPDDAALTAERV
jgi:polysaccharide transporter, PST family